MKELIEEIKTLVDKCDLIGMSLYGYNQAIDEVLETIESCKPKVLDNPDPECGWYYFSMDKKSHNSFPSGFYWLNSLGGYRVRTDFNSFVDVSNFEGKWIKAIEHEME